MASSADDVSPAAAPLQLTPLQMPAQRIGSPTTSISVSLFLVTAPKRPPAMQALLAATAGLEVPTLTRDSAMQTEGHLL